MHTERDPTRSSRGCFPEQQKGDLFAQVLRRRPEISARRNRMFSGAKRKEGACQNGSVRYDAQVSLSAPAASSLRRVGACAAGIPSQNHRPRLPAVTTRRASPPPVNRLSNGTSAGALLAVIFTPNKYYLDTRGTIHENIRRYTGKSQGTVTAHSKSLDIQTDPNLH